MLDLYLDGQAGGLAREIYEKVRAAIDEGRVRPGERLPPSRDLARELGVSRHTVTTAYGFLVSEGFLAGDKGGGTRVTAPASRPRRPAPLRTAASVPVAVREEPRLDLRLGVPDPALFPDEDWRRQVRRAARLAQVAEYGDPAGDPVLRAAIATWIHRSRGVAADPERTIVTAGAQQAFDLVLGVLVRPGDAVVVEDPGYRPFSQLAQARGAKVVPVRVDAEGLVVAELPARARVVYVTPSHQFPLGPVLSLRRRRDLLAWARGAGAHIIEDDYDSEFRFTDRPPSRSPVSTTPAAFSMSAPSPRPSARRSAPASSWRPPR